jgi:2-keto-4-pentenoate hydratase/2-oxohepta-3-ene-1,7-dioic acid hydratase in catechol pathway
MERPQRPLVFTKFTTSRIADGDPIRIDRAITERVDWEVEAAVSSAARLRVAPQDALSHVFGYTVANDVSARDVQFSDGQWVRGKGLETFCPLGPLIVTADEISDPQAFALRTPVNGEVVQDRPRLRWISASPSCCHSFTLEPGDVLLTGTPWGCGEFVDPVRLLADGDVVETEVERTGTLRNPVAERR